MAGVTSHCPPHCYVCSRQNRLGISVPDTICSLLGHSTTKESHSPFLLISLYAPPPLSLSLAKRQTLSLPPPSSTTSSLSLSLTLPRPFSLLLSQTDGQIDWQALQVIRGLRNLLNTDKPEHHSIDRLKERGVETGNGRHSTLQGRERSVFNQTNIGTVSRATLGRLLRDGAERVWAFPSATMPS